MNSVTNKTRLAERHRDKLKKELRKSEEGYKNYNRQLQKAKKKTKL